MRYSRRAASDAVAVVVAIGWLAKLADGTDAADGASVYGEKQRGA